MTGPQKFSLSLLISTLTFAGFAVWSFLGLQASLETSFFRGRVEESLNRQMEETDKAMQAWFEGIQPDLEAFFGADSMVNAFRMNQAAADIIARKSAIESLRQKYSINAVRLFDLAGALHESTRLSDIKEQSPAKSIEWLPRSELKTELPIDQLLVGEAGRSKWVLEPESGQIIWSVPVRDQGGAVFGTAVVYCNLQQLTRLNERWARTSSGERFRILDAGTVLFNMPAEEPEGLAQSLREGMASRGGEARFRVEASSGAAWYVYVRKSGLAELNDVFLVETTDLEFPPYMRYVFLGIVFLTVFLIAFLILNLRHDEMVVLSDRIKRLQINVLKQYVERKDAGEFDAERWQSELKARRVEVRDTIKRGLGRKRRKDPLVDDLIDKEWDEILEVLGARKQNAGIGAPIDLSRLEELVEKVINNYQHQLTHQPAANGAAARPVGKAVPQAPAKKAPAAPPKPLVPVAVELVEDDEDLDEAEAIEEVEEAEAAEELDEAEAIEEVEEAEAAEELDEAEAIEEVEEAEAAEELDEAEAIEEVEEAEAAEELDEAEAIEEVEEAEAAEELDEAESAIPVYDEDIPSEFEYDLDALEPAVASLAQLASGESDLELEELDASEAELDELDELDAAAPLDEAEEVLDIEEFMAGAGAAKPARAADEEGLSEDGALALEELGVVQLPGLIPSYQLGAAADAFGVQRGVPASLAVVQGLEYLSSRCRAHAVIKPLKELDSLAEVLGWDFQTNADGVYQIPDSVFSHSTQLHRSGDLGELVESVTKDASGAHQSAKLSIGGLMGFSESDDGFANDDLSFGGEHTIAQAFEHVPEQRTFYRNRHDKAQNVVLTERGIDFDFYLRDFRDDEGGRIKAMYSFSKRFKAESALLCDIGDDGLKVHRTLGIPHFFGDRISYRDGGDSLTDLNTVPAIVVFRSIPALTGLLGQACVDPAVAKSAVFLPLIHCNALSYIVFGYSQVVDMSSYLADYVSVLPVEKAEN